MCNNSEGLVVPIPISPVSNIVNNSTLSTKTFIGSAKPEAFITKIESPSLSEVCKILPFLSI